MCVYECMNIKCIFKISAPLVIIILMTFELKNLGIQPIPAPLSRFGGQRIAFW